MRQVTSVRFHSSSTHFIVGLSNKLACLRRTTFFQHELMRIGMQDMLTFGAFVLEFIVSSVAWPTVRGETFRVQRWKVENAQRA